MNRIRKTTRKVMAFILVFTLLSLSLPVATPVLAQDMMSCDEMSAMAMSTLDMMQSFHWKLAVKSRTHPVSERSDYGEWTLRT